MNFARLGPVGSEIPVLQHDGASFDLRPITADIDGAFLAGGGIAAARAALEKGELSELDAADLRVGAPIARPGKIVCIGLNYADHAAEGGMAIPAEPVIFMKDPTTMVGPFDDVLIPRQSVKTDWEVELGVVIGTRTAYLDSRDQARAHIAGYVVANDVSERTFQLEVSGGQWSKGKCSFGFSPTGPWLVTADEVDPDALSLRSFVNGEPRQDSNTADMIFPVDEIVYQLSQYMTLEPGDLILTGTPEGVALSGRFPYLAPGDVVEIEIDGLGRQRQVFTAWEPAS